MHFQFIKKAVLLAAAIISGVFSSQAAPLTPQRALSRATSAPGLRTAPASAYKLAHTEAVAEAPAIYIFSRGDHGFIITPADDLFPAVLGYCDSGSFDYAAAPEQFKWWIESYAAETQYYLANPDRVVTAPAPAPRREIAPLVTTQWDQEYPYNLDCPMINGQSTMTGCVATAMAQIINYHKYPEKGKSQFSYTWNGEELSFVYARSKFDFENMIDSYLWGYNNDEADAVARLMYACGVAVTMDYGTVESGAPDCRVASALRTFFRYDGTTRYMMRNYFSTYDWEALVYEEMAAGRPVVYGGFTQYGGHEFVCDGYRDGYYHINWGWSGSCDGYYLLDALEPGSQGIGGYEGGYNFNQTMISGIRPDQGSPLDWYPLYATSDFSCSLQNEKDAILLRFPQDYGLFNYSAEELHVNCYLKVIPEDPTDKNIYFSDRPSPFIFMPLKGFSLNGYTRFNVYLPKNLPAGSYKGYIGFITPENRWLNLLVPYPAAPYVELYVNAGGDISVSKADPLTESLPTDISLLVTDIAGAADVAIGENAQFRITISNEGPADYDGRIYFALTSADAPGDGAQDLWRNDLIVNVPAGREIVETAYFKFNLPVGDYILSCYEPGGDKIGNDLPLKISEEGSVASLAADDALSDVYTIEGRLLRSGADNAFIASLPKGFYIIRNAGKAYKLCR